MSIFIRIKQLSKDKHIPIARIEHALNMGNGTIRRWDTHIPSIDKVAAVADFLGVSMEYLITGKQASDTTCYTKEERENILQVAKELNDYDFDTIARVIKAVAKEEK